MSMLSLSLMGLHDVSFLLGSELQMITLLRELVVLCGGILLRSSRAHLLLAAALGVASLLATLSSEVLLIEIMDKLVLLLLSVPSLSGAGLVMGQEELVERLLL